MHDPHRHHHHCHIITLSLCLTNKQKQTHSSTRCGVVVTVSTGTNGCFNGSRTIHSVLQIFGYIHTTITCIYFLFSFQQVLVAMCTLTAGTASCHTGRNYPWNLLNICPLLIPNSCLFSNFGKRRRQQRTAPRCPCLSSRERLSLSMSLQQE